MGTGTDMHTALVEQRAGGSCWIALGAQLSALCRPRRRNEGRGGKTEAGDMYIHTAQYYAAVIAQLKYIYTKEEESRPYFFLFPGSGVPAPTAIIFCFHFVMGFPNTCRQKKKAS